ncbi:probable glucuronosyltransferase Os01g0157700 [Phragmites australis]|uniref:probable glucuronosyltransferase Os01g0157700 n=1 Tax=Phragmites australis TaxID=29695 RepID=UPI002D780136|nr:probable glucuronosyltransferase Os01g0157700 [Phragmites australis]
MYCTVTKCPPIEETVVGATKRVQPWIRAAVHFSLCFAVAALAPLAATGAPSAANIRASFLSPFSNAQRVAPATPFVPDLGLLLIVTVTRSDGGMAQEALLTRLAHTLRHVAPPPLWIVVGAENRTARTRAVQVLCGTGVMFRHLTYDAAMPGTSPTSAATRRTMREERGAEPHRAAPVARGRPLRRLFRRLRPPLLSQAGTQRIQALMGHKEPP